MYNSEFNPLHSMSRLDTLGILVLELPQPKRLIHCKSLNTAFLSIDGIKCDIPMFRGKNRLSCYHTCGHFNVIWGIIMVFLF
jgi:hypothetical protein